MDSMGESILRMLNPNFVTMKSVIATILKSSSQVSINYFREVSKPCKSQILPKFTDFLEFYIFGYFIELLKSTVNLLDNMFGPFPTEAAAQGGFIK